MKNKIIYILFLILFNSCNNNVYIDSQIEKDFIKQHNNINLTNQRIFIKDSIESYYSLNL